jgi:hypothetical protein
MRGRAALPNKELKLTKPGQIGASQLNSSVGRTWLRTRTMRAYADVYRARPGGAFVLRPYRRSRGPFAALGMRWC